MKINQILKQTQRINVCQCESRCENNGNRWQQSSSGLTESCGTGRQTERCGRTRGCYIPRHTHTQTILLFCPSEPQSLVALATCAVGLCKFHFPVIHSPRLVSIDGRKLESRRVSGCATPARARTLINMLTATSRSYQHHTNPSRMGFSCVGKH